jgi:two-component system, chemotaxis family, sensor kinase CheA
MDDLLSEFLTETTESLDVIDVELVRFESSPEDTNTLNNIFRLVHTIKGTCGFLGLPRLEAVAHAGETLLGRFRDKALKVTPEAVSLVLESIDHIKSLVAHLGAEGAEPEGEDRELIGRLEAAAEGRLDTSGEAAPARAPKPAPAKAAPPPPPPEPVADFSSDPELAEAAAGQGRWDPDQGRHLRVGEVSLAELEAAFASVEGPEEIKNAKPTSVQAGDGEDGDGKRGAIGANTIRVNVDVLESLMTMVSELVLTRNQLMQILRTSDESEFKTPLQRLSGITAELQECIMKTRMQPIGSAWKKLPRIVRDASRDLGKKIELVMEGEHTELDRQVLELIKDPLTHMIRNSCDHAIETPADRLAAGKPETGVILLRAYHEGGHIIIEVGDDGAGLKTERIRQKAVEKGVVDPSEAHTMTDAQVHRLIFAPGFSTAAKVTNISGRGVGMDVVKTNVELIGGAIDLKSKQGEGTTFMIKIPLTLAIISALIVGVGEHRFAVPQLSVIELVRAGRRCEHKIEYLKATRVLRLRDKLLPLVGLSDVLGLSLDGAPPDPDALAYVVVMQVGETRFGLVVDEVFDTEEIVVKPLSKRLGSMAQYSGATILGDGAVIMILDPNGVARSIAQADSAVRRATQDAETSGEARKGERMSLLLFRAGGEEPRACPLNLVTRLEDLDATTFEMTHRGLVVQYRGKLMPLVHAEGPHAVRRIGRQPVLVFSQGESVIGLAVDQILDIVEEHLELQLADSTPGVLGTAVLKGKSTSVIDVGHFLGQADPAWARAITAGDRKRNRKRVLLVEAHPFFRNMLGPLVMSAGYDVEAAHSLEDARQKLASGASFDIILADADEPGSVEGLTSEAQEARAAVIPLTNRGDTDPYAGATVVAKSDRHALLAALEQAARMLGEAA